MLAAAKALKHPMDWSSIAERCRRVKRDPLPAMNKGPKVFYALSHYLIVEDDYDLKERGNVIKLLLSNFTK